MTTKAFIQLHRIHVSTPRVPPVFDRGFFHNKLVKPPEPPLYAATLIAEGEADIALRQHLYLDLDQTPLTTAAVWTAPATERIALDCSALDKDFHTIKQANTATCLGQHRLILDAQERDRTILILLGELPANQQEWLAELLAKDTPEQLQFPLP